MKRTLRENAGALARRRGELAAPGGPTTPAQPDRRTKGCPVVATASETRDVET
jgi:hypothetical protein